MCNGELEFACGFAKPTLPLQLLFVTYVGYLLLDL